MRRQNISFTEPNDEWLRSQIASKEYSSKSELVNDLIRQARKNDIIRNKIELAEKSRFTSDSKDHIPRESKDLLHV